MWKPGVPSISGSCVMEKEAKTTEEIHTTITTVTKKHLFIAVFLVTNFAMLMMAKRTKDQYATFLVNPKLTSEECLFPFPCDGRKWALAAVLRAII